MSLNDLQAKLLAENELFLSLLPRVEDIFMAKRAEAVKGRSHESMPRPVPWSEPRTAEGSRLVENLDNDRDVIGRDGGIDICGRRLSPGAPI